MLSTIMRSRHIALPLCIVAGLAGALAQSSKAPDLSKEWPTYGHDPGGMRFSPLTEIKPGNVDRLKVAWVYHMRPEGYAAPARAGGGYAEEGGAGAGRGRGGGTGFAPSENTPLVIDGVMYMTTPYARVVAIDPTSGKEVWNFHLPTGSPATRGLEYWTGDAQTSPQIVFGSSDGKLYSLDAKTGKPNNAFGDNGIVNMNTPDIMQGLPGRNGAQLNRRSCTSTC
ncbi:MAG: PQQ-binding-like beta-propeller repeat protein [Ignavibacteriota bacterium]